MISGSNSIFNILPIIRESFLKFTNNFSGSDNSSSELVDPDTLFLSNNFQKNNSFGNFSFFDNSLFSNRTFSLDKSIVGRSESLASEKLKRVSPQELKQLGSNDKKEFFKTLLPAALEAERIYGVPASVTLAQAALESGWGRSPIGGYNIFGIKGKGPAGTVNVKTKEWENGQYVSINANFAKYNNFHEAVMKHGQVFHASYRGYSKGLQDYAANKNDYQFVDNVASTYATSPTYKNDIKKIMQDYDLVNMSKNYYIA